MDPLIGSALVSAGGSLLGGLFGSSSSKKQAQLEYERQKEFAQHGIRWRVADAEAAGVHKLYALGAPAISYQAGFSGAPMADAMAAAGQDISRAIASKQTNAERLQEQLLQSQINGQNIDNEIRATELASTRAKMNASQMSPGMPPGVHDGNAIPQFTTVKTPWGDRNIVSSEYGQIMENYPPEMLRHFTQEAVMGAKSFWNDIKSNYRKTRNWLRTR